MKSPIRSLARCGSAAAVLAALAACGGGDSGSATSVAPPPPPPPATYTVGGTVTGLTGSGLVLQNPGGADLPISASGAFTFANSVTIDLINQFLYVADDGAANVAGFKLDASTGGLTFIAGSPFVAGALPDFLAVL